MLDILLHAAVAVVATLAALLTPWSHDQWPLAFAGALVWVAREAYQNRGKWGNWFRSWSPQKKREAVIPAVTGLVTALAITLT